MKVLFLGDVFGERGIFIAKKHIEILSACHKFDLIAVNIENSSVNGKGPCESAIFDLMGVGVDIFTGGNHSFSNKDFLPLYSKYANCIRPCNFPFGVFGGGHCSVKRDGCLIVFINVQLRAFMRESLSCPIRAVETILQYYRSKDPAAVILVDVHGEATAEKMVFANFFDGKVSGIFGTHTHVQTADDRILPKGTAYITDVGMTGALNSSIGMCFESEERRLLLQIPVKQGVEKRGEFVSCGIICEVDAGTGRALSLERVRKIFD